MRKGTFDRMAENERKLDQELNKKLFGKVTKSGILCECIVYFLFSGIIVFSRNYICKSGGIIVHIMEIINN